MWSRKSGANVLVVDELTETSVNMTITMFHLVEKKVRVHNAFELGRVDRVRLFTSCITV